MAVLSHEGGPGELHDRVGELRCDLAIDFAGDPANGGGIAQRAKVVFNQRHHGEDR